MKIILIGLLLASLAYADPSTTHIWVPAFPAWGTTNVQTYTGNGVTCTAWVPSVGITNATSVAWYTTAGAVGALCSLAVFTGDGTTKLLDSGPLNCVAAGAKIATGLSASTLTAGVKYEVCTCENNASSNYLTANNQGDILNLAQSLSVKQLRTAANNCTNGSMPSSTGVLTQASINGIIALISTNTP